jgi:ABC-type lipoprotein release transport system permease subunit
MPASIHGRDDNSARALIVTALVVVVISLATVIFQVARAAIANPVEALRNE